MQRTALVGIVGAAVVMSAAPAFGGILRDDIVPPPWERFQPFTTFQEWDFNDPGDIGPDGSSDPYNPNTHFPLIAKPGPGVSWQGSLPGTNLSGIYFNNGGPEAYIDFCVPNWIDQEPLKIIWIQINGIWADGTEPYVEFVEAQKGTDFLVGEFNSSEEIFPGFHRAEEWLVRPNPDWENIRLIIPPDAVVNQVVIDTISFPTPGAVSAFGLAGLALVRRRR